MRQPNSRLTASPALACACSHRPPLRGPAGLRDPGHCVGAAGSPRAHTSLSPCRPALPLGALAAGAGPLATARGSGGPGPASGNGRPGPGPPTPGCSTSICWDPPPGTRAGSAGPRARPARGGPPPAAALRRESPGAAAAAPPPPPVAESSTCPTHAHPGAAELPRRMRTFRSPGTARRLGRAGVVKAQGHGHGRGGPGRARPGVGRRAPARAAPGPTTCLRQCPCGVWA